MKKHFNTIIIDMTFYRIFLLIIVLIFLFPMARVFSNSGPSMEWSKTYGGSGRDYGYSVQQASDGGYILTGHTWSFGSGGWDVYLVKTDSEGNEIWSNTFGGSNDDGGECVQQTMDGGYIIAGFTTRPGTDDNEVYLIKTGSNGNEQWTKTYGGDKDDYAYFVQQTTDGGYIITGITESFTSGGWDVYLLKTNSNGNEIWSKSFGSTNDDIGEVVQQTSDEGYIITGRTKSFGSGGFDVYLIKTDTEGNEIWNRTYGGVNDDYGRSIRETTDDGYIITGKTKSFGSGGSDVYLIKTDSEGDEIWSKTFGGSNDDGGHSVIQTFDGGYVLTGYTYNRETLLGSTSDVYLLKTDSDGNEVWSRTFGNSHEYGYSVHQTANGDYIIVGHTNNGVSSTYDIYLVKVGGPRNEISVISDFGTVDGNGSYYNGSTVTFSISPTIILGDSGIRYVFSGWTSDSPGGYAGSDNPVELTLINDVSETAVWTTQYYLTVEAGEGGSVSTSSGWHNVGSQIILVATPDQSHLFLHWDGLGNSSYSGTGGNLEISINGPTIQKAIFEAIPRFTLSIQTDFGSFTGEGTYSEGSSTTFSVFPSIVSGNPGIRYIFAGWSSMNSGGYTGPDDSASVVMYNDITENAEWKTQYHLTVEIGEGGSVSPQSGWYDEGTEVKINATPDQGFSFTLWEGNGFGSYSGPNSSYTIRMSEPISEQGLFSPSTSPEPTPTPTSSPSPESTPESSPSPEPKGIPGFDTLAMTFGALLSLFILTKIQS